MTKVLLQGQHINKVYDDGSGQVQVLNDVDFTIDAAEMVAIVGASGSGKSTLMHILAGLDRPTSGAVLFDGQDVTRWSASQLAKWRNQNVGFVYQFHHLLPEFNALENVAMPLLIQGRPTAEAKQRATELLERVGLAHRLNIVPHNYPAANGKGLRLPERLLTDLNWSLLMNPRATWMEKPQRPFTNLCWN